MVTAPLAGHPRPPVPSTGRPVRRLPGSTFAVIAAVLSIPGAVGAQTDPALVAQLRALIVEAQAARRAGDHQRAADLASRALEIESSPSLQRFAAEEQAASGSLAAALGSAELCVREAERDGSARDAAVHAGACRTLAESLRARVARLVVRTPADSPADLEVRVRGSPHVRALWDTATLVDPGRVVVEATATGFEPFRAELEIAEGTQAEILIALQPLQAVLPPDAVVVPEPSSAPIEAPSEAPIAPPMPVPVHDDTFDDVGAPVVIGLGAAAAAAGIGVYVARGDAITERDSRCARLPLILDCATDAGVIAAHDRAVGLDAASAALWIAGGTLVAAGVTWLIVDIATEGGGPSASASLRASADGGALTVAGAF